LCTAVRREKSGKEFSKKQMHDYRPVLTKSSEIRALQGKSCSQETGAIRPFLAERGVMGWKFKGAKL